MMNSFFDKMGEKLMPFASKVSANRYLNAIKEGFFGVASYYCWFLILAFYKYSY